MPSNAPSEKSGVARPMMCFTNDASCHRMSYAVMHYLNTQWQEAP